MFEGEAYRPYIQLCRELRLERELEAGDYYANLWADFQKWEVRLVVPEQVGWIRMPDLKEAGGSIWLPRLDQLLAMLEKTGYASIEFCGRAVDMETYLYGAHADDMSRFTGWHPTREEAAGRLWRAVTPSDNKEG